MTKTRSNDSTPAPKHDPLAEVYADRITTAVHARRSVSAHNAALIVSGMSVYTVTAAGVATLLAGSVAGSGLVDIDSGLDADLNSIARIATARAWSMPRSRPEIRIGFCASATTPMMPSPYCTSEPTPRCG